MTSRSVVLVLCQFRCCIQASTVQYGVAYLPHADRQALQHQEVEQQQLQLFQRQTSLRPQVPGLPALAALLHVNSQKGGVVSLPLASGDVQPESHNHCNSLNCALQAVMLLYPPCCVVAALLSIRDSMPNLLDVWTRLGWLNDTNHCKTWTGVTCDVPAGAGKVVEL